MFALDWESIVAARNVIEAGVAVTLQVTLVAIAGGIAGGTVLVIEAGSTRLGYARGVLRRLNAARARVLGVVMTKLDPRRGGAVYGYGGYNQWLANRGYAVLSVNFRGSTGFGKDFTNAGNGEWAGKMHDDLIDAAKIDGAGFLRRTWSVTIPMRSSLACSPSAKSTDLGGRCRPPASPRRASASPSCGAAKKS